jgi:hypothetical protein
MSCGHLFGGDFLGIIARNLILSQVRMPAAPGTDVSAPASRRVFFL